jgi:hypothetical protein
LLLRPAKNALAYPHAASLVDSPDDAQGRPPTAFDRHAFGVDVLDLLDTPKLFFVGDSSTALFLGFLGLFAFAALLLALFFGPQGIGFIDVGGGASALLLEVGVFLFECFDAPFGRLECGEGVGADVSPLLEVDRDGIDGVPADSL